MKEYTNCEETLLFGKVALKGIAFQLSHLADVTPRKSKGNIFPELLFKTKM